MHPHTHLAQLTSFRIHLGNDRYLCILELKRNFNITGSVSLDTVINRLYRLHYKKIPLNLSHLVYVKLGIRIILYFLDYLLYVFVSLLMPSVPEWFSNRHQYPSVAVKRTVSLTVSNSILIVCSCELVSQSLSLAVGMVTTIMLISHIPDSVTFFLTRTYIYILKVNNRLIHLVFAITYTKQRITIHIKSVNHNLIAISKRTFVTLLHVFNTVEEQSRYLI